MNTKQMSKIRNKAKHIMVAWLKGLLNPNEQAKVNVKNVFKEIIFLVTQKS